jgi:hypothetical protein
MGRVLIELNANEKICQNCYLPFSWRKKLENVWEQVKFCSEKCRKQKSLKRKVAIENEILSLAAERGATSFCASEVLRRLYENWRPQMAITRQVARKLMLEGKILVTQSGKPVKDLKFRGPIRLKAPS